MSKAENSDGRLDSWKDIASYLGRDVRTAIRWEKDKGLPVRRVPGGQRQAVFAYRQEIDGWLNQAPDLAKPSSPSNHVPSTPADTTTATESSAGTQRYRYVLGTAASLSVLVILSVGIVSIRKSGTSIRVNSATKLTDDGTPKYGLVTDGSQIYFSEKSDGKMVLSALSIAGGAIRHLQTGLPDPIPVDVSPNGSDLLVLASKGIEVEKRLWVVPLSGQPRGVGTIRCHSAAWSPDGRTLAYSSGKGIFLTFDDGKSTQNLYSFDSVPSDLNWSADGKHLRFLVFDSHTYLRSAWELALDDHFGVSSVAPLRLLGGECCAGWSKPSMGYFFYFSKFGANSVWAARDQPDGREDFRRQMSIDPLNVSYSLSAAGKVQKLFVLNETQHVSELLQFDVHTQGFVPYLPNVRGAYVNFSPDGKWICFVRLSDETLWISRSDGSEQKQLTSEPMLIDLPRWSPDGKLIAFTAEKAGRPWRIFVLPRTGGTPREATTGDDSQGAPTWSPDGRFLAYANVDCQETNSCTVYRVTLATGEKEELPRSRGFRTARWSPDGKFVAAIQPEQHSLWLFNVNTEKWARLADEINGDDLSWSRDARYIYVARSINAGRAIVRIPVLGGEAEEVVNLSPFSTLTGDFSPWFCLTPNDSVILLRKMSASEIYAIDWSEH